MARARLVERQAREDRGTRVLRHDRMESDEPFELPIPREETSNEGECDEASRIDRLIPNRFITTCMQVVEYGWKSGTNRSSSVERDACASSQPLSAAGAPLVVCLCFLAYAISCHVCVCVCVCVCARARARVCVCVFECERKPLDAKLAGEVTHARASGSSHSLRREPTDPTALEEAHKINRRPHTSRP